MHSVFGAVPPAKMYPHGPVVGAYLQSSFTHLRLPCRLLGVRVLDAALEHCADAVLHSLDGVELLTALAATLSNRFQSGLAAGATSTRHTLWGTVVRVQQCLDAAMSKPPAVAPVSWRAPPPMRCVYVGGTRAVALGGALQQVRIASLLAPLLMQDLFECVPGTDTELMALLLSSLALVAPHREHCVPMARDCLNKCLLHLAGHFPLSRDFSQANAQAAALLLASGNSAWALVAAEPVAVSMLSQPSLPPAARALLLRGCESLWTAQPAELREGAAGARMAEAFVQLFGARLSAAARVDCLPSLELLLCSSGLPDALAHSLLRACAKCLWQCASGAEVVDVAAVGVLRALWGSVRRGRAGVLLTQLLVPFFSVQLDDGVREGPFARLSSASQIAAVSLFGGLDAVAPAPLVDAWRRLLVAPSTAEPAALTLLHLLHRSRRRVFSSLADYWRMLARDTLLQPVVLRAPIVASLCRCIRDATLLDGAASDEQQAWLWGGKEEPGAALFDVSGAVVLLALEPLLVASLHADNADVAHHALSLVAWCLSSHQLHSNPLAASLAAAVPVAARAVLQSTGPCGRESVLWDVLLDAVPSLSGALVALASERDARVVDRVAAVVPLTPRGAALLDRLRALALPSEALQQLALAFTEAVMG